MGQFEEIHTPSINQSEVDRIESIIGSKTYFKNSLDMYFLSDYIQGFNYIHNQIQQHEGDASFVPKLIQVMKFKSLPKGEIVYKQGQKNDLVYFIVKGKVSSWTEKSKDSMDQERNLLNQLIRLQKLIEMENQLRKDQDGKEMGANLLMWEREMDFYRKQLAVLQKYDKRISQQFKTEEGIATITFEKTYYNKVDIFGYKNTLHNTRPLNTMITETECKFLVVKGEDFYSVFHKEVENVKMLLRVLYTQFSTIDKIILEALAQHFTSFFFSLNQEVYSLNPQAEWKENQQQLMQGRSQLINQVIPNDKQIAFYIIKDGTVLVRDTSNGSNYNVCSLNSESILGIDNLSPTYQTDFATSHIQFISVSNRLQLLGITKAAIEEIQQVHHNNQIMKTLVEIAQQRSQFILQRIDQIKSSLNPFQSNLHNCQTVLNTQTEQTKNSTHSGMDSKYGFINQIAIQSTNQMTLNNSKHDDDLMRKASQKNYKKHLTFKVDADQTKTPVHLKSLISNMLKFRPSKVDSQSGSSRSPNSTNRHRRVKQEANNIKIQDTLLINSQNSQSELMKSSFSSKNLNSNNYSTPKQSLHQQNSSTEKQKHSQQTKPKHKGDQLLHYVKQKLKENKKTEKEKSPNRNHSKNENEGENQNEKMKKFGQSIVKAMSSIKQMRNSIIDKKFREQNKPQILERQNYMTPSQEDLALEDILTHVDFNGNKVYERFYEQDSLSQFDEYPKQQNIFKRKKSSLILQNNSNNMITMTKSIQINDSKKDINTSQKQKSGEKNAFTGQQITPKAKQISLQSERMQQSIKHISNAHSQSPNLIKHDRDQHQVMRDTKSNQKKLLYKRAMTNKSYDQSSSLSTYTTPQKKEFKFDHEKQLANELQLSNDFELKNGKLISKRPPTFSQLRDDFITSQNPYSQCNDLIEKLQMIQDSNKNFIEKNSQDYRKDLEKRVEEQKKVIRLLKQKNKSDIIEDKKPSQKQKMLETSQRISGIKEMQNSSRLSQNVNEMSDQSKILFMNSVKLQHSESSTPVNSKALNPLILGFSRQQSLNPNEVFEKIYEEDISQMSHQSDNQTESRRQLSQHDSTFKRTNSSNKKSHTLFQLMNRQTPFQNYNQFQKQQFKQQLEQQFDKTNTHCNTLQNDSSLISVRSLSVVGKNQQSRPNSAQVNFAQVSASTQVNTPVNLMMIYNFEHSFQPSNSYVTKMPSFEPKLPMNSVNRPKTANTYKILNIFEKINQSRKNCNHPTPKNESFQQQTTPLKQLTQSQIHQIQNLYQNSKQLRPSLSTPNKLKISNYTVK